MKLITQFRSIMIVVKGLLLYLIFFSLRGALTEISQEIFQMLSQFAKPCSEVLR